MTDFNASDRDVTRAIRSWLHEDRREDVSRIAGAVLDQVETTRQRRSRWPARRTLDIMNKLVPLGLGAAALVAVLVIGSQFLGPAAPGGVGGAPSAEPTATPSPTAFGGSVQHEIGGDPATTDVDAVADGASVSGTAVTTFGAVTHTVQLACASRNGDTWALAGTTEQTTVPGEKAGDWSVVVVRDGSPQHISIWFSADPETGGDCDASLASRDFSTIALEDLQAVKSGALVPPPDLAP